MTSRILVTPVTSITSRSKPRPNPAWGAVPNGGCPDTTGTLHSQSELRYARFQAVQPLFPGAATHDLADTRHQHVHGAHGPAVFVLAHVERFDVLGIIVNDDRLLEVLLGQVALMLGLDVLAEGRLVFELPGGLPRISTASVYGMRSKGSLTSFSRVPMSEVSTHLANSSRSPARRSITLRMQCLSRSSARSMLSSRWQRPSPAPPSRTRPRGGRYPMVPP